LLIEMVALALFDTFICNVIITPSTNSKFDMVAVRAEAVPDVAANNTGSIKYV